MIKNNWTNGIYVCQAIIIILFILKRIKREKDSKHRENVHIEDVRYIEEKRKIICEEDNIEKGKP